MVNIRKFNSKGSETTTYEVQAEAEQVLAAAWQRGALVVDEDKQEVIKELAPSVKNVLIVDPLVGG